MEIPKFRQTVFAVVCSSILSLGLGFIENPNSASIIGAKRYGYPFAWRTVITSQTMIVNYSFGDLIADLIFWFLIVFLVFELVFRLRRGKMERTTITRFIELSAIFLLSALIMDFMHEFGHALWGILAGGQLAHMQIAYFVVFPRIELVSNFVLGFVRVTGLTSSFGHGLFLLGGSLTTNAVAWLLAFIMLKRKFSHRIDIAIKVSGIIGLLDLPFYVFLPQIGLRHWVFLGGDTAEPLIGARELGVSDPVFYLFVFLVTFALAILYFEPFRKVLFNRVRELLNITGFKK